MKKNIECVSKFKGELNDVYQKFYIGKDSEGNLYKSNDVLPIGEAIWESLLSVEYTFIKNNLHEIPFEIGSAKGDKIKKAGINIIDIPEIEI